MPTKKQRMQRTTRREIERSRRSRLPHFCQAFTIIVEIVWGDAAAAAVLRPVLGNQRHHLEPLQLAEVVVAVDAWSKFVLLSYRCLVPPSPPARARRQIKSQEHGSPRRPHRFAGETRGRTGRRLLLYVVVLVTSCTGRVGVAGDPCAERIVAHQRTPGRDVTLRSTSGLT